mmetsp:Transcript_11057/g.10975  ORF Transcript_11057/g.10975 Transcript_11057/m.10975 type:complete len:84 (-) Transcript_11057:482-733(-)
MTEIALFGLYHLIIDAKRNFEGWHKHMVMKAKDKILEHIFPHFSDLSTSLGKDGFDASQIFFEVPESKREDEKRKMHETYKFK